ncbi:MAG: S8 family serine peptidase [Chloroflexaceae bacterium]|nr:S8 family serine peptidase [Chloroflexaceae bacterium]NJO06451.1 S8 family serine peptidase [Chloroflexaceae bacterium]
MGDRRQSPLAPSVGAGTGVRGYAARLHGRVARCLRLAYCLLWLCLLLPAGDSAAAQPAEQWALQRIGAACAWAYTQGSPTVTVAVIDSGVDPDHPDLVGRLRGDGYDFVDNDHAPRDENGHGTHVAGIIAATLASAEGVRGLAPAVQILPVRTMNEAGWGDEAAIAEGIRYATRRGVQVINLSLGMTLWPADEAALLTAAAPLGAAVRDAQAAGVLVVVAAGNDFVPFPNLVAYENPDVLLVAASDEQDTKAPFSNSGPWVDVVAPGQHIRSTMPTYEVYLTSAALPPEQRFMQGYDYLSGTSQAAPHVAALAALLFAAFPDATATEVQAAIRQSADASIYNQHPAAYRRLHELGSGRIDACAALAATQR